VSDEQITRCDNERCRKQAHWLLRLPAAPDDLIEVCDTHLLVWLRRDADVQRGHGPASVWPLPAIRWPVGGQSG